MHNIRLWIIICLAGLSPSSAHSIELPEDKTKAVILAYHRIDENAYPDSSLRLSQFIEHINEIENGDYNVVPLKEIIKTITKKQKLPPKTIAITFDGAYKSAYQLAMPLLVKKEMPFTIFYSASTADENNGTYMNWKELNKIKRAKTVSLSTLPYTYAHIPATGHKNDFLKSINKTRQRHREQFSEEAKYFAHPFGEHTPETKQLVQEQGYIAAFGLQSGPAFSQSDLYAIPRFSMTEDYADIDRFRLITSTLPLPVTDLEPKDPILSKPLQIGFTIPRPLENTADKLSCFLSGYTKPEIEKIGTRIEIRSNNDELQYVDKARLNCTAMEENGQWRWFGLILNNETPNTPQPDEPLALQE